MEEFKNHVIYAFLEPPYTVQYLTRDFLSSMISYSPISRMLKYIAGMMISPVISMTEKNGGAQASGLHTISPQES